MDGRPAHKYAEVEAALALIEGRTGYAIDLCQEDCLYAKLRYIDEKAEEVECHSMAVWTDPRHPSICAEAIQVFAALGVSEEPGEQVEASKHATHTSDRVCSDARSSHRQPAPSRLAGSAPNLDPRNPRE